MITKDLGGSFGKSYSEENTVGNTWQKILGLDLADAGFLLPLT
jgi:hypothetical protein